MKKQNEASTPEEQNRKTAMRVSAVSIAWNVILSLFKLIAGIVGHSGAMISDAVHSASDVFSTIVVILGVNIASRQSDEDHQYGHDRLECVAAIILAVVLFATGLGIGIGGVNKIIEGSAGSMEVPGMIALIAAVVSISIKEWMFWYTRGAAKKINSGALMADAWYHRSDALFWRGRLAFGSQTGISGFRILASVIICIFIVKAAYDIFKDAIDKMVDKSCDEETEKAMQELILCQKGVKNIDMLHTRLFGARIYVDIEIAADGNMTLREGHEIAQQVHDRIEEKFPLVKHCMVHVNPV